MIFISEDGQFLPLKPECKTPIFQTLFELPSSHSSLIVAGHVWQHYRYPGASAQRSL